MRIKSEMRIITCPACGTIEKVDTGKKRKFVQEVEIPSLKEKQIFFEMNRYFHSNFEYSQVFCDACGNVFLIKVGKSERAENVESNKKT